ncbi:unnamed protein product [Discula destructiva]
MSFQHRNGVPLNARNRFLSYSPADCSSDRTEAFWNDRVNDPSDAYDQNFNFHANEQEHCLQPEDMNPILEIPEGPPTLNEFGDASSSFSPDPWADTYTEHIAVSRLCSGSTREPEDIPSVPRYIVDELLANMSGQASGTAPCVSTHTRDCDQTESPGSLPERQPIVTVVDLHSVDDQKVLDDLLLNPTVATQFRKSCTTRLQQHLQSLDRAYDKRLAELEDYTRKWRETTKELWIALKWGPVGDLKNMSQQEILAWKGPQHMGAKSRRYGLRSQAALTSMLPFINAHTAEPMVRTSSAGTRASLLDPAPMASQQTRHSQPLVKIETAEPTLTSSAELQAWTPSPEPASPQERRRYQREAAPSPTPSEALQSATLQQPDPQPNAQDGQSNTQSRPQRSEWSLLPNCLAPPRVLSKTEEPTTFERALALSKALRKSGLTVLHKTSTGLGASAPMYQPGVPITATSPIPEAVQSPKKTETPESIVVDSSSEKKNKGLAVVVVDQTPKHAKSESRKHLTAEEEDEDLSRSTKRVKLTEPDSGVGLRGVRAPTTHIDAAPQEQNRAVSLGPDASVRPAPTNPFRASSMDAVGSTLV